MSEDECRVLEHLLRAALRQDVIQRYEIEAEIVTVEMRGALIALHHRHALSLLHPVLTWWMDAVGRPS